jgi:hypothetical protein
MSPPTGYRVTTCAPGSGSTIKRLLARHGYPPDAQPVATELVIRQMETFADEWSPRPS